jgi:predicted ATPase
MLKILRVHNFKTYLNAELRFGRQHLLIGKNNSGKTALVTLLNFIALTARAELDQASASVPGGLEEICNWYLNSDLIDISCTCELVYAGAPHHYTYALQLSRSGPRRSPTRQPPGLNVIAEQLSVTFGGHNQVLIENNGTEALLLDEQQAIAGGQPAVRTKTLAPQNASMLSKLYELPTNQRALLFRNYLNNWRYFSLSPLAMRAGLPETLNFSSTAGAPIMIWWTACDPVGSNLSTALFVLKSYDDRRYRRIIEHVKLVEPDLEAINYIPAPGKQPVPFISLAERPKASWQGLSDGTLRALGLALIIETASACSPPTNSVPCLSLIEEPENGIFPGLLRRFFDLFDDWAPTAQFFFTSHSPYFIDMFDDKRECVTILRRMKDRTELFTPPKAEPSNDDEPLSLSAQYASELFQ